MKVAIIGAGNVGSTAAMRIAEKHLADVVMVDVKKGLARGKAFDITDSSYIIRHEVEVSGTEDFSAIKDSSVVVVTAGLTRKPGMKREELLAKNSEIVRSVSANIKEYAPQSIVIVVTNPLDVMTYVTLKECGFSNKNVFGMAGDLDTSRFIGLVAEKLKVKKSSIGSIVMGSHGDTMVPVISQTKVAGSPLERLLSKKDIEGLIKMTKTRGAEVVALLGQGSAYYAPSAAIADLVESILTDRKSLHCVSALLEGEYGISDICIGVPAIIGKSGIEEILRIDLLNNEKKAFERSARAIQKSLKLIKKQEE